ncbi:MAG: hypothetical protein HDQ88_08830 [Clostridia bacterium]|nr:hypothetical protein [Clostridia bacterium]
MFEVGTKVRIHLLEKDSIFHDRTGTVIESSPNIELYKVMFDNPPRNKSATPVASNWFDEKNIRPLDQPV